jgi:hypothetical protein
MLQPNYKLFICKETGSTAGPRADLSRYNTNIPPDIYSKSLPLYSHSRYDFMDSYAV